MSKGPIVDTTNIKLISKLKNNYPESWEELLNTYAPLVYHWCRRSGFSPEDASDISQEVFTSIHKSIDTFHKENPEDSFRSWLWTITRNRICDFIAKHKNRPRAAGGSGMMQFLKEHPSPFLDSDTSSDDSRIRLLHIAMANVAAKVTEKNWQAFEMVMFELMSHQEVAQLLEMNETAIRVNKSRMLKRLKDEMIRLQELNTNNIKEA